LIKVGILIKTKRPVSTAPAALFMQHAEKHRINHKSELNAQKKSSPGQVGVKTFCWQQTKSGVNQNRNRKKRNTL